MSDRADEVSLGKRIHHPLPRLKTVSDRLLDQGVHASRSQLQRGILVETGGDGDDCHIDAGGDERVDVRQHLEVARNPVRVSPGIGDRDEVDAVDLSQYPCVVTAHHPDAEKSRT